MKKITFLEFLKEKQLIKTIGGRNVSLVQTNLISGTLSDGDRGLLIDQLNYYYKGLPEEFKQIRFLSFPSGETAFSGGRLLHGDLNTKIDIKKEFSSGKIFPGVLNNDFTLDSTISSENIDKNLILKNFPKPELFLDHLMKNFSFLTCFTKNSKTYLKKIFKEIIDENIKYYGEHQS